MTIKLLDRLRRGDQDEAAENAALGPVGEENPLFTVPIRSSDPSTRFSAVPRKRTEDTPQERKAKMMVFGMLGAVPISVLAILMSLVAIASGGGGGAGSDLAVGGIAKFQGAARIAIIDYLAGSPSRIPTAPGVDFAAARTPTAPGSSTASAPPKPIAYADLAWLRYQALSIKGLLVEVHTFAVVSPGGYQELSIPISDHNGPVVAGLPSSSPAQVGVAPLVADLQWTDTYSGTTLTQKSLERIQKWFEAYAGDDRATLYDLTRDPQLHEYRGLGGYRLDGPPTVSASVNRGKGFYLTTATANLVAANDAGLKLRVSYDLLLSNITEAVVSIVSWGPQGSGPSLMPYDKGMEPKQ